MLGRARIILVTLVAAVVVIAVAGLIWWQQRDEAPEAVDLESAVAQVEAVAASDGETADSDTAEASGAANESEDVGTTSSNETGYEAPATRTETAEDADPPDTGADDTATDTASADQTADAGVGLAGVWAVKVAEGTVDLLDDPAESFAGFRVNEVLAGGIGDFTAVGRTADVSGSIELTDTALVAATVEVTMATLRTDNGSRDGQVRRALNTNAFPRATFTLVEPIELSAGFAESGAFSGTVEGDLMIKGVTNRAAFYLEAQLVGDTIVAVGSSEVTFADYGVTVPSAPIVVSAEDQGIMEFQLLFTR